MKSWKRWFLAAALVLVPASAYAADKLMTNDGCPCEDRCDCNKCGCDNG